MSSPISTDVVGWTWDQQSVWSRTADQLKASLSRARAVALALTIAVAAFVTAADQFADASTVIARVSAGMGTFCALGVALIQARVGPGRVEASMRTRSVSESLKAEVYKYLAGVAPYRGADRDAVFRRRRDEVLGDAGDLVIHTSGVEPARRPLPAVHDVASYATERVKAQAEKYYRPRGAEMKARAENYRRLEIGLAAAAAVLSAIAAGSSVKGWAAWAAVITTIAAAVVAHSAMQRYNALAVEYSRTAAELERLLADSPVDTADPAAADAFVATAEKTISQQNEAWMAKGMQAAGA
jgi:hypothetical protein